MKARIAPHSATIRDLSFEQVSLVVAAAGYEPRCVALMGELQHQWRCSPEELGRKLLLLEFDSHHELESRRKADEFYHALRPSHRLSVGSDDGAKVLQAVSDLVRGVANPLVVVDYSCMSRMIYLSLLRLVNDGLDVFFSYSVGKYGTAELNYPISAVGTVRSVPGFEGLTFASRPRLHIVGLGYDGLGTLALMDRLEASRLVVFWADPGASIDAPSIARRQNDFLIARAVATFRMDLRDVVGTAGVLSRIASEVAATDTVVFVPIGPKPQVLASALAVMGRDHCSLIAPHLGSGGIRDSFPQVEWSGELLGTRIRLERRRAAEQ